MRTYREYYALAVKQENIWYRNQTDTWWRCDESTKLSFVTKGDYIETTRMISATDKNDVPIFINHTNLKNSELTRLHYILSRALIDWLNENKKSHLYSFTLNLFRDVDCNNNIYEIKYGAQKIEAETDECPTDIDDPELQECANFLCGLVEEFVETHSNNIPLDWNVLKFSIDSLRKSCKSGWWSTYSDSYFNIGNINPANGYTSYVVSM